MGLYVVRPLQRDGRSGFSLRWLTRHSLWNLFNVAPSVAAFVFQLVLGYPPVLPLKPPKGWDALDKTQQETAIVSYDMEPAAYIAIAVVLTLLYGELKAVSYRPVGSTGDRGDTYQSLIAGAAAVKADRH